MKQNQKPKQKSEAKSLVLSSTKHQKPHHLQKPQKAIKPTRKAIKPKPKPKPTNLLSHPNKHPNCRSSQDDAQSHHPMPNHSQKRMLIRHRSEPPTSYSFFARMCHQMLMQQEKGQQCSKKHSRSRCFCYCGRFCRTNYRITDISAIASMPHSHQAHSSPYKARNRQIFHLCPYATISDLHYGITMRNAQEYSSTKHTKCAMLPAEQDLLISSRNQSHEPRAEAEAEHHKATMEAIVTGTPYEQRYLPTKIN